MSISIILRGSLYAALTIFMVAAVALSLVIWFGVTLDLNSLRAPIANAASTAMGRAIRIDGEVSVKASLWPTLKVGHVTLANGEGFSAEPLARIGEVDLQLDVLSLLAGQVQVRRLAAEAVALNLEANGDGSSNWQFSGSKDVRTPAGSGDRKRPAAERSTVNFEIEAIELTDIDAHYTDHALGKRINFKLDHFNGRVGTSTPLKIDTGGSLQDITFTLNLAGPPLQVLRQPEAVSRITMAGDIAGTGIEADAKFSFVDSEPRLEFGLNLGETDVGALIAWLGLSEGIQAETSAFAVDIALSGDSLYQIASNTEIAAKLGGGSWVVDSDGGSEDASIRIGSGTIKAGPAQPLVVALDGTLGSVPVDLSITGALLIDYVKREGPLPIGIDVEMLDASLKLDGKLVVPIKQGPFDMAFNLSGENLTAFNEKLGLDLPPLGSYRVSGQFLMNQSGYELRDLAVAVGESKLDGSLKFDHTEQPHRLDVKLSAPKLQLNDFNLKGWSPEGRAHDKTAPDESDEEPPESMENAGKVEQLHALLSAETLNRANVRAEVSFHEVLSGDDLLGEGRLVLSVEGGKLEVSPLHLAVPGGSVDMNFSFHPTPAGADIHLDTLVERFDYGILARRVNPETAMAGKVFLDVTLDARAQNIKEMLASGRGQLDFALLPKDFDAGVFDLWAVNLLSALSSKVDDEPESVVNCILARFRLADGIMDDLILFMDTSRMSVAGKARIDFKNRELDIYVKPKAKKAEFFSVAVPVDVSGSFDKWRMNIGVIRTTWAGVSFLTSPLHVPFRRLFSRKDKPEGEQACRQAWERSEEIIRRRD